MCSSRRYHWRRQRSLIKWAGGRRFKSFERRLRNHNFNHNHLWLARVSHLSRTCLFHSSLSVRPLLSDHLDRRNSEQPHWIHAFFKLQSSNLTDFLKRQDSKNKGERGRASYAGDERGVFLKWILHESLVLHVFCGYALIRSFLHRSLGNLHVDTVC